MSAETHQMLVEALELHLADEYDDAILQGFVLQCVGVAVDDMDTHRYLRMAMPGQPLHTSIGLYRFAIAHMEAGIQRNAAQSEE